MALDSVRSSSVAADDSVSQLLLADTRSNSSSLFDSSLSGKSSTMLPKDGTLKIEPIQLAMFEGPAAPQPRELSTESKSEANSLAYSIKSKTEIKASDKDEIHSAFNKQLAKTEGQPAATRAETMRMFASAVNNTLREGNGKMQFSENATGDPNKISFSLVDNGDGNLVAGIPPRTVYDTMEYSLKKGEPEVKNIPERSALPEELRTAYDFTYQNARQMVMKEKYAPALEAVSKDAKLKDCKNQQDLNKALGLPLTATAADFQKELVKRMMAKVGQPDDDFNQAYSQDVNRAFVKKLDLKPGIATQTEIIGALDKVRATVPKDWKPEVPKAP